MTRVRIVGGPWPERIGCEGTIVDQPDGPAGDRYPWAGRSASEVIVRLDDDPLDCGRRGCLHTGADFGCGNGRSWTCAIGRRNVEVLQ